MGNEWLYLLNTDKILGSCAKSYGTYKKKYSLVSLLERQKILTDGEEMNFKVLCVQGPHFLNVLHKKLYWSLL